MVVRRWWLVGGGENVCVEMGRVMSCHVVSCRVVSCRVV